MLKALWDLLYRNITEELDRSQRLAVYLFEDYKQEVVYDEVLKSIRLHLVHCPVSLLDLYRQIIHVPNDTHCLIGEGEVHGFFTGDTHSCTTQCRILIEGNTAHILALLRHYWSKIASQQTHIFLFDKQAQVLMRSTNRVAKPIAENVFGCPKKSSPLVDSLFSDASISPMVKLNILRVMTESELYDCFTRVATLIKMKSPCLLNSEFWQNRSAMVSLLKTYGKRGGQMHPRFKECIETEATLLNKGANTSLEKSLSSADPRLQAAFEQGLYFPMKYPEKFNPPRLLIHEANDMMAPLLTKEWIGQYISSGKGDSAFICILRLTDVFRMYVGESEESLKHSLAFAQSMTNQYQWVILIIDNLELLSRCEGQCVERNLVTALLMYLDGVGKRQDRLAIIGLSRLNGDQLDEALIRPGRFETHIKASITF